MAHGKNQRLRFKRRRTGETDYRRRMRMLRGGATRAVVRVSNTQTTCQLINYDSTGDEVMISVTGKTLVDRFGWPLDASRKSVPASYLTGFGSGSRRRSRCCNVWQPRLRRPARHGRRRLGHPAWRGCPAERRAHQRITHR